MSLSTYVRFLEEFNQVQKLSCENLDDVMKTLFKLVFYEIIPAFERQFVGRVERCASNGFVSTVLYRVTYRMTGAKLISPAIKR